MAATQLKTQSISTTRLGGWLSYEAVVPTRTTADDPTYIISFAAVDLTDRLTKGTRVSWVQNSIRRYGIVVDAAFSTNTTVTILTICNDNSANYDVLDTASFAISGFRFSPDKAPVGFPLDFDTWTLTASDTTDRSQALADSSLWYNLGSLSLSIPIGAWEVSYAVAVGVLSTSGSPTFSNVRTTLSTANNSEVDTGWSAFHTADFPASAGAGTGGFLTRSNPIVRTSRGSYYLNSRTNTSTGNRTIRNDNSLAKAVIKARCAYL